MADWCVERLGRIADTPFAFLLPFGHFSSQRGSRDNEVQTLVARLSQMQATLAGVILQLEDGIESPLVSTRSEQGEVAFTGFEPC